MHSKKTAKDFLDLAPGQQPLIIFAEGCQQSAIASLVPNKAALFEGMVSDRLDRFLSDFGLHVAENADIEAGLNAALMACADLTLDPEVVALQRIILQAAGQFLIWRQRSTGTASPAPPRCCQTGCAYRSSAGSSTSIMSRKRRAS